MCSSDLNLGEKTLARITVYIPKFEALKVENMFVITPKMEVNFPTDFVIKSRSLTVEYGNIPTYVAVSLPSSLKE